jgi:hypothetical protein
MTDIFIVRPGNKDIVFTRTDTGRLYKISNRRIKTDGHIDENNGLNSKAVEVSPDYVAELLARFGAKSTVMKGKASWIRRFRYHRHQRREEVVPE